MSTKPGSIQLYTFAEPQLCEFATRLKEDIPDSNVIFETLTQPEPRKENELIDESDILDLSIQKDSSDQGCFNLGNLEFSNITTSPLNLSEKSPIEILLFLGRFKERMVTVFESPF